MIVTVCALLMLAFLDTTSEVTLRVPGVVIDQATASHPEFSRFKAHTMEIAQSRISMPGKTFWWDGSYPIGKRVDVAVVEGRFTGWHYVSAVEAKDEP